jgi:hypothetical protein
MDLNNAVVRLCVAVTQAEFAGRSDQARLLAWQAWQAASDDYEACIAAHYLARYQENLEEALRWNQRALDHAEAVHDDRVKDFYPSLYLCMGNACEMLGNLSDARRYYELSAALGVFHQDVGE